LAASTAAQIGPTQFVTSDAGGNLATNTAAGLGLATQNDIANVNGSINSLNNKINNATTGVAMAFAMAGVPTLLPTERVAMTANWGNFQGANGMAINAAFRVADAIQINAGLGVGLTQNIQGGRLGVRVGF
jgi:hypothetical protein